MNTNGAARTRAAPSTTAPTVLNGRCVTSEDCLNGMSLSSEQIGSSASLYSSGVAGPVPLPELAKRIAVSQLRQLDMLHAIARSGDGYAREAAELYALVAANFSSLLYWAAGRSRRDGLEQPLHPDIVGLSTEFDERFPHLWRYRTFMAHPKMPPFKEDEETWLLFDDGPWIAKKDGSAIPIIDNEMNHGFVHGVFDDLVAYLNEALGTDPG